MKNNNVENQISRMKAMMSYGLTTENKNTYKSVEYEREGADGKMYGIVREGTKFYIKVADKKNGQVLKENYDYIGGFNNRKNYEYTSYANALKQFDLKMRSINESVNRKEIIIESWNPDKKEELAVEATERMRREIMRQRQIMGNAALIQEKKNYTVDLTEECCKVDKECAATQKDNIKKSKDGKGEPVGNGGDPFTEKVDAEQKATQTTNTKKEFKPVMNEGEQVLGWNDNADYLDTTHGTEIGDSAPFTEGEGTEKEMDNGVVEEGTAMHNTDNQNSPEVGTNEIGDDAPFTETVTEAFEDEFADDVEGEDFEADGEMMGDVEPDAEMDVDLDLDADVEGDDIEGLDDESFDTADPMEERISAMESLLNKIAEKLGVDAFEDDDLYGEEGVDAEPSEEEPIGDEAPVEDEPMGDEAPVEDDEQVEESYKVYESASAKKVVNEDNLDYFGKHPAYQKSPMELPSNKHKEMADYYDMNDDSVQNEEPYGKEIGDSAPFKIAPEAIENAITEAIVRALKKKI